MRLKRTISEAEFADAIRHVRVPSRLTLEMAHADLVQGINQAGIARKYNRTKGTVSQASKRVWHGFLKSKGYREVRVVLGDVRAWIVNGWHREALYELNYSTRMPAPSASRPRRPPPAPKSDRRPEP